MSTLARALRHHLPLPRARCRGVPGLLAGRGAVLSRDSRIVCFHGEHKGQPCVFCSRLIAGGISVAALYRTAAQWNQAAGYQPRLPAEGWEFAFTPRPIVSAPPGGWTRWAKRFNRASAPHGVRSRSKQMLQPGAPARGTPAYAFRRRVFLRVYGSGPCFSFRGR